VLYIYTLIFVCSSEYNVDIACSVDPPPFLPENLACVSAILMHYICTGTSTIVSMLEINPWVYFQGGPSQDSSHHFWMAM